MYISTSRKQTLRMVGIVALLCAISFFFSATPAHAFDLGDTLAGIVYGIATAIGSFFLGIGGLLLDTSIYWLIVEMGVRFTGGPDGLSGLGVAVNQFWTIIRDVLNMLFIFGLIYIGIKTILNSEDSGTRRMLGMLIAAALLINFSLYITQAIVDVSNVAATQVYQQIRSGIGGTYVMQPSDIQFMSGEGSIAGAFFEVSRMTSWFGGDDALKVLGSAANILVFSLLMMLFFIVAGVFFALGAIMIVTRFVALTLYMVFSPIMFLGWVLPSLTSMSTNWWKGFLKHAFFAPAYLFMLYLSLVSMKLLTAHMGETSGSGYSELFEGGTMQIGVIEIVLYFIVMLGFLYASIIIGNKMSIAGAGGVSRMGKGLQGLAYRKFVGGGINKFGVGLYDRLDKEIENKEGNRARRRFAAGAKALIGGEEGRRTVIKARDYGAGGVGYAEAEKMETERKVRANRNIGKDTLRAGIKDATKKGYGSDERRDMERTVRDASSAQIVEMAKDNDDRTSLLSVAGDLTESQFKAVMDDKEIDDTFKNTLGGKRGELVAERIRHTNKVKDETGKEVVPKELSSVIAKADTADLKAMGYERAYDNAGFLTAKQIEDWKDLTPTEKEQIKDKRKDALIKLFDEGRGVDALLERVNNDSEVAKLPDTILTDPKIAPKLTTNTLDKILDNDKIGSGELKTIKDNVLKEYRGKDLTKYKKFFDTPKGQRYG